MSVESTALPLKQSNDYRAILWGGLTAGILDITAAIINTNLRLGHNTLWVFQSIASALMGANAYKAGLLSAALGGAIHFFNAFAICTIYFIASRKLQVLVNRWVIFGVLYGIVAYFVMYGIVLRLTFHRNFLISVGAVSLGIGIHIVCVGLPISFWVHKFSKSTDLD
ncbi:MAG TPA: hypothetical protein VKD91_11180 [Pyrinomonadaceae bacterium]|nr:hypothetical protein [Pyrinomonadaceae bacterium]